MVIRGTQRFVWGVWAVLLGLCSVESKGQVAQTYFVPVPEEDLVSVMTVLENTFGPAANNEAVISIVPNRAATILYYDHWEDGFEGDITSPTQTTTQVWGDNNLANGRPPGFVLDVVSAGSVITLRNVVPAAPRVPANIFFDGGDKIAVSKSVAVTRAGWDNQYGPVVGGAMEVLDQESWGTTYQAPVGTNIMAAQVFEYVALSIMAGTDGTTVDIDIDNDSVIDVSTNLNQGQAVLVSNVVQGASVSSSEPVQSHLFVGDIAPEGLLETRVFSLFPVEEWSDSYYSPVGTSVQVGDRTDIWLYNPTTNTLDISFTTQSTNGVLSIAAGAASPFLMPVNEGGHFFTTSEVPFYAVATVNSTTNNAVGGTLDNDTFDWGFALVPEDLLTSELLLGWGPGSSTLVGNGSPMFVTSLSNTTLFVDFDGDPSTGTLVDGNGNRYDTNVTANTLQSVLIFDTVNGDNDQTGMRVYTTNDALIAGAWGADPNTAGTGSPFLDMGTSVLPVPTLGARKTATLIDDLNGNGVLDSGDILQYSVIITNEGLAAVQFITLVDDLPSELVYAAGSAKQDGVVISDDVVPPAMSIFPLDETGYSVGTLLPGTQTEIAFEAFVVSPLPAGTNSTTNEGRIAGGGGTIVTASNVGIGADLCECFLVPDANDILTTFDRATGSETFVGSNLVNNIDAIAIEPGSGHLFAADGGQFGGVDPTSGLFTNIGSGFGTATGALSSLALNAVDGLSFDATTDTLYGTQSNSATNDLLFAIDPVTGTFITNFFGVGVDYVAIPALLGLADVGDIAVNPFTGVMYAAVNGGALGTGRLVIVNKTTGALTDVGLFGQADIEGLGFDANGILYATSGTGGGVNANSIFTVDTSTGAATLLANLTEGTDYEAVDCLSGANLGIFKTDNMDPVVAGESLVYSVVATNFGFLDAPSVVVTDTLPAEVVFDTATLSQGTVTESGGVVIWDVGLLGSLDGATLSITGSVAASQTPTSQVCNIAQIVDLSGVCTPRTVDNTARHCTEIVAETDLSVTKAATPEPASAGQSITYSIVVSNAGPSLASGVVVPDLLPVGVSFASATPSRGVYDSGTNTWTIGDMTNGTGETLTLVVDVDPSLDPGSITNLVSIVGDQTDPNLTNNTNTAVSTVQRIADLGVTKSDVEDPVRVGSNIVYTIGVTNAGPSLATSVVVTDSVPVGLQFVGASPSIGSYDDSSGEWTVGNLAPNGNESLTLFYLALSNAIDSVTNVATISSGAIDTNSANDVASEVTDVQLPGINIIKLPDLQQVQNGDDALFSMTITNLGNVTLSNVAVVDSLVPNCDLAGLTLAAGASTTYMCTAIGVSSNFTNLVGVAGTPPIGPPVTAMDDAVVDVIHPSITMEKTVSLDGSCPGSQSVQATNGAIATYCFSVTNTGDAGVWPLFWLRLPLSGRPRRAQNSNLST